MPVPAIATGTLPCEWTLVRKNVGWSGEIMIRHWPCDLRRVEDGADDVTVDLLNGFHFLVAAAFVRGLVGRLDVDAHDIVFVEGVNGRTAFGGVVGVEVTGGTGDFDSIPADESRNAAKQIDGGDHRAARAVLFGEGLEPRGLPLSPEPNVRGRPLACLLSGRVHWMVAKHVGRRGHQFAEDVAARAARIILEHRLVGDVVRSAGARVGRETGTAASHLAK